MKLTKELLESFGIITEAKETKKEELKVGDEGVKETEKLVKPEKEEKTQDGQKAQDEVSVNPEADDREKEIKEKEKLDEKEQKKMFDDENNLEEAEIKINPALLKSGSYLANANQKENRKPIVESTSNNLNGFRKRML